MLCARRVLFAVDPTHATDAEREEEEKEGGWSVRVESTRSLLQGPKLFYVTGSVIFATAVARLVCPYLLG